MQGISTSTRLLLRSQWARRSGSGTAMPGRCIYVIFTFAIGPPGALAGTCSTSARQRSPNPFRKIGRVVCGLGGVVDPGPRTQLLERHRCVQPTGRVQVPVGPPVQVVAVVPPALPAGRVRVAPE